MDHNKDDEEVQGCVNQPKVGSTGDIIISQKNINDINTEACNSDNGKNIPKEHLQFPDGQILNAANSLQQVWRHWLIDSDTGLVHLLEYLDYLATNTRARTHTHTHGNSMQAKHSQVIVT